MKKSSSINYLAVDLNDNETIIAEGNSIGNVMKKAKKKGKEYIITPDLKENITYIF